MSRAPAVRLTGLTRRFGEQRALDAVSLEIGEEEFFSMLGPSGSGKTTCLRLIAGFDEPDAGGIELHGVPAVGVPAWERDVNTVFQDYALFPHMDVERNVGYGLMLRKVPEPERRRRVAEALELVRLPGLGARRPVELSGGQRQRVALARALVNRPRVLLLDEPLGALDLKLRQQMQEELRVLQRRLGITFVYVTHDQEEALAMSDRLAVFNAGRIEQVGTPAEVYEQPATAFVAGFVGTSNLVEGPAAQATTGQPAPYSIRPERIHMLEPGAPVAAGQCVADGGVEDAVYLGMHTRFRVRLDAGGVLTVVEQNRSGGSEAAAAARGRRVRLAWQRSHNRPVSGGA